MSKDFPRGTDGKGFLELEFWVGMGGWSWRRERSIHDCTILSESLLEVGFVLAITFESAVFFSVKPQSFRDGDLFVICDGYDWGFRYLVIVNDMLTMTSMIRR